MTTAKDHLVSSMAASAIAEFPESLILLDTTNKIKFINRVAREKFKLTPVDNNNISIEQLFAKREDAARLIAQLHSEGTCDAEECSFFTGDRTELRTSYKGSALHDESGVVTGYLLVFGLTSTGRLKDYASRLESKIKELDQFAYIVSHDLKAPLRAIGNLTSWIKEDLEGTLTGDSKQNMDLLVGRVNRMEALINGVLEYSRVGRIEVKPELVDVQVLLEEVIELLAPASNVSIVLDPNMPTFETRRILLQQVFSNLISNAIKHNDKQNPVIRVGCSKVPMGFEFFVEDNGPGIAKEHHDKIFVIFQTLQSRDKFESTGVGLTIVKRIIEEQAGSIRLESTPGKGSKFTFTWTAANPDHKVH